MLAGALLVGDSVRASLRDLVLQRLGHTDDVVVSANFFREALAEAIARPSGFRGRGSGRWRRWSWCRASSPIRRAGGAPARCSSTASTIASGASTTRRRSRRSRDREALRQPRAGARDRRRGRSRHPRPRAAAVRHPARLAARPEGRRRPHDAPDGARGAAGVAPRRVLARPAAGRRARRVRAAGPPAGRSSRSARASTRCSSGVPPSQATLPATARRDRASSRERGDARGRRHHADGGRRWPHDRRGLDRRPPRAAGTSRRSSRPWAAGGIRGQPVFTYLANTLRAGDREIPYSLVTATNLDRLAIARGRHRRTRRRPDRPIVLTEWAARDLQVAPGDRVCARVLPLGRRRPARHALGGLPRRRHRADRRRRPRSGADVPRHQRLAVARGLGSAVSDRSLAHPPGRRAVLGRVSHHAEGVRRLEAGQRSLALALRRADVDPRRRPPMPLRRCASRRRWPPGCATRSIRSRWAWPSGTCGRRACPRRAAPPTSASTSSTSASSWSSRRCCSSSLFFKLGIEQRAREVGLLRAVGFDAAAVRRLFLGEGAVLAGARQRAGRARRRRLCVADHDRRCGTWWVDAVGTTALVAARVARRRCSLGRAGGMLAAVVCIWWTLRGLRRVSERSLLAGQVSLADDGRPTAARRNARLAAAIALAAVGAGLVAGAAAGVVPTGRRVLRRRRRRCWRRCLCLFAWALRRHPAPCRRGPRLAAGVAARHPQRDVPARAQRAVGGRHRLGDVHPDRRGRVPPRRRARDGRPAIRDRRLPGVRRDRCCRWPTIPTRERGAIR